MGNLLGFVLNTVMGLVILVISIVWIPLTYIAQFIHFLWRKVLGLDT